MKAGSKETTSAQASALASIFSTALESLRSADVEAPRKKAIAELAFSAS